MTIFSLPQLTADVKAAEAFRGFAYDDATGQPIKPGTLVKGHVTAGYGLALDVDPLTEDEAAYLLANRIEAHCHTTLTKMPWVGEMTDARQRALFELAFNLGDRGLSEFVQFLALLRAGAYDAAADDLAGTKWARQVHGRAARIIAQIRNG